jgi:endonuclease YncB( thermonuclease family)
MILSWSGRGRLGRRVSALKLLCVFAALQNVPPLPAEAEPRTVRLAAPPHHVNDGDTFEADLNGNGRLEFPGERVRLLYVDAPELHESHKGQDLEHGLPARDFLRSAVQRLPITITSPGNRKFGRHGRRLAVVEAGGRIVNLELIRRGHGYFDTRYGFPAEYDRYAEAEGEAFSNRRGIWSTAASRKGYLARLRKEGKTPRAAENALFVEGVKSAARLRPHTWLGRFLRLRGRLIRRNALRKGAYKLLLQGAPGERPLRVYVSGRVAPKLPVTAWRLGALLEMDGFFHLYRNAPELVLHYGRAVPGEE